MGASARPAPHSMRPSGGVGRHHLVATHLDPAHNPARQQTPPTDEMGREEYLLAVVDAHVAAVPDVAFDARLEANLTAARQEALRRVLLLLVEQLVLRQRPP